MSNNSLHPVKKLLIHGLIAGVGATIGIGLLGLLSDYTLIPLIVGSFGASTVLLFGFPELPFSRPRNLLVGHFLSSLIGLLYLNYLGSEWWSMALSVGTAIFLMIVTGTVHPPAGSNPVIVFLTQPNWTFLLFPTLAGSFLIWIVASLFRNVRRLSVRRLNK
jgi:CBS-domain-containing membrane protein